MTHFENKDKSNDQFINHTLSAWIYRPLRFQSLQRQLAHLGLVRFQTNYSKDSVEDLDINYFENLTPSNVTESQPSIPEGVANEIELCRWAQHQAKLRQVGPVWGSMKSELLTYRKVFLRVKTRELLGRIYMVLK